MELPGNRHGFSPDRFAMISARPTRVRVRSAYLSNGLEITLLLTLLLPALVIAGCSPVPPLYSTHPSLAERAKEIRTVVLMPPTAEVFELDASEISNMVDDWSAQARKHVAAALQQELKTKVVTAARALSEEAPSKEDTSNFEETIALFDAIASTVDVHVRAAESAYIFQDKIENFDYSLGREVIGLTGGEGDALILVGGTDHISTGGRVAREIAKAVISLALRRIPFVGGIHVPQGGITEVNAALVDARTGAILWYKAIESKGGHDLREPDSAADLVKRLFEEFPIGRRD